VSWLCAWRHREVQVTVLVHMFSEVEMRTTFFELHYIKCSRCEEVLDWDITRAGEDLEGGEMHEHN
jgi:hypothetical protein